MGWPLGEHLFALTSGFCGLVSECTWPLRQAASVITSWSDKMWLRSNAHPSKKVLQSTPGPSKNKLFRGEGWPFAAAPGCSGNRLQPQKQLSRTTSCSDPVGRGKHRHRPPPAQCQGHLPPPKQVRHCLGWRRSTCMKKNR